jgi:hypothetical protein
LYNLDQRTVVRLFFSSHIVVYCITGILLIALFNSIKSKLVQFSNNKYTLGVLLKFNELFVLYNFISCFQSDAFNEILVKKTKIYYDILIVFFLLVCDCRTITGILLKVQLNTITLTLHICWDWVYKTLKLVSLKSGQTTKIIKDVFYINKQDNLHGHVQFSFF